MQFALDASLEQLTAVFGVVVLRAHKIIRRRRIKNVAAAGRARRSRCDKDRFCDAGGSDETRKKPHGRQLGLACDYSSLSRTAQSAKESAGSSKWLVCCFKQEKV